MSVEGAIAEFARGVLPYTWDALSKEDAFGDALLQRNVDAVKEIVFGSVIEVAAEDDFPLRVLRWCGKRVALELITPGIDMWMNQAIQISATGTSEVTAFEQRSEALRKLREQLLAEILREEPEIAVEVGVPIVRNRPRMGISTPEDDLLLTPNPREFSLPYRQTRG